MCCRKLVLVAIFAGVLTVVASEQKLTRCCTEVSTANITAPIISYRYQKKKPPCVEAVIFKTTEGYTCTYLKQTWVVAKMKELEESRKRKITIKARP